ncbi:PepSY domain-containing protein [Pseudomonas sp. S60]|uniref:PepSY domain-containing protein n=1 Tax=unclassified Pseudomonas TaxID=196821 RepID=UPI001913CC7D|nr:MULTISPECIES: PepSY domain-containing protein [unclassified Pseudomonas]MBK4990622.1 PepSY domain-containing protein [Pseudomonas sp. S36]MBK5009196.1 PepSY domain-containing protein [Pseudomonas sp. S60]
MRNLCLFTAVLGITQVAQADTLCATAEKSTWKSESDFRRSIKQSGYRITKFRVTEGNCYEIYGFDTEGKRVELYFHPITFALVKAEPVPQR